MSKLLLSLGMTLMIYLSLYWFSLHLCFTLPAPSGHFLDRRFALKSLLQPLLLGEPKLRQMSLEYLAFKELIIFLGLETG